MILCYNHHFTSSKPKTLPYTSTLQFVCANVSKFIEPGMWRQRISKFISFFTANSNNFEEGPLAEVTARIIHINCAFYRLWIRPLLLLHIPKKLTHRKYYTCRLSSLSVKFLTKPVTNSHRIHHYAMFLFKFVWIIQLTLGEWNQRIGC